MNVPNRLSVLYEYKSDTVNGLNNDYANSYVSDSPATYGALQMCFDLM